MAINTKRFQIVWMVCTALIEFKCMMDMTFIKAYRMFAILAQSTITFIDELAYLTPLVNGHSREPGISFVVQDEFIHTIPCLATPSHAQPRRAKPGPAPPLPQRRYPCLTSPRLATPCPATPSFAPPCPAKPLPQSLFLTSPYPTSSNPSVSRHALKFSYYKPAEFRAVVANANGLASQYKYIVHGFKGNLVINDIDCKR